ncbi:PLDc N-terminal domain-containing protein [Oceanobacillus oncorhynchi]|uniref:PLDc N-terminal domain-containing protein n=1 Tax=Oceanobacillus oncorhynchi TaxID=545501 RepID=UPI002116A30E|nr:PLDc N-terminal domain-containing protein [Oceanobacillus oncorhynchi]UUI39829.1 PLDc N-terminal domain-containing protein [Oceanobacillus oncorhynchi]
MNDISFLMDHLALLIPLIMLQLILMVTALVHVIKHPDYRFGNKGMWIIIVVLLQIIGPVFYFVFGKGEHE